MKVVSLNLSTLATGKYAPIDKSNLANVKWMINWKEILGEHYTSNHVCRLKAKLVSAQSTALTTANNLGTVRMSFTSNYSNISNGFTVGVPIIRETGVNPSVPTQFIGTISTTTLNVSQFGYGQMLSVVGSTSGSSTTLTITSSIAIPIGSVLTGYGISGYVVITGQTSTTSYTMSSAQNIAANTPITALLPNNVCLPIGALITGNGVSSGTVITAQTGAYTYTINNSQTVSNTTPMLANPNNYYFDLDIQASEGLTMSAPMSNYLNIQFLRPDETTLMTNVPEYTVLLNFVFDQEHLSN